MKDRFLDSDVVARLFCALYLFWVGAAAFTSTTSVPGRLKEMEGDYISVIFIILLCISLAIVVDVCVNSLSDHRYNWNWIKRHRLMLYIVGGLLSLIPSWYIGRIFGLSVSSTIFYIGSPTLIFWMGLCDLRAKYGAKLEAEL